MPVILGTAASLVGSLSESCPTITKSIKIDDTPSDKIIYSSATFDCLRNCLKNSNTHKNMADAAAPSAPIEEQVANLHLDEVTGERVSKSELKKRQKQRMKEEEKKKKEAAAPPKPVKEKKSNAEAEEKELNPNVSLA